LFVSHNLAAVQSLCERAILLNDGCLQRDGNQLEVVRHYLHGLQSVLVPGRYTAAKTGSSAGKIIDAIVRSEGQYSKAGYSAGRPLEFEVRCDVRGVKGPPALGIGIDNAMGDRIVTMHSNSCRVNLTAESYSECLTFRCRISNLILQPGDYFVKLSYEEAMQPRDVLAPAFTFAIRPAGQYGSSGHTARGMILCDQEWQLTTE
jgi:lipopolysaccharide transport system ATP-binding protein